MANRTTGRSRGYSGQKGGAHQLPWREDAVILARIPEVRRLRYKGLTRHEIAVRLGIDEHTVDNDLARERELIAEQTTSAVDEHIANLRQLARQTHELLDATGNQSLNKSALVSQLRQIEMDIASLDGSKVERSQVEATLHNGDLDTAVLAAYDKALGSQSRGIDGGPEGRPVRPRLVGPGESEVAAAGDETGAATA